MCGLRLHTRILNAYDAVTGVPFGFCPSLQVTVIVSVRGGPAANSILPRPFGSPSRPDAGSSLRSSTMPCQIAMSVAAMLAGEQAPDPPLQAAVSVPVSSSALTYEANAPEL